MNKSKKNNFFPIIIALIILFFSTIIFLSIPVLFNYKSIESHIEKKFFSEFNINLQILDKVKYQFIPQPHLLVNKANLSLSFEGKKSSNINTENLKIYLSPKNLYSKSNLKFDKVEIKNTNFRFKFDDIKIFHNYLYNKKNNEIIIKKSNFFFLDEDNKTILISPINKILYSINKNDNYKKLKIKGNIFDINYNSSWKRYYETPNRSQTEIKLKNPNVVLKNFFLFKDNNEFEGEISIKFLNEIMSVNYFLDNEKFIIESPKSNDKIKIFSNFELNPFYFKTDIKFVEKEIDFFIDEFLYFFTNYNPDLLGNLNGILNIDLDDIKNELINSGKINILFNEKSIDLNKILFKINGGQITSEVSYIENGGELIFLSKNILQIKNKKKFAKKFQIKLNLIENIDKIYFNLSKNIDTGKIMISQIKINGQKNKDLLDQTYNVKNIQELKTYLKRILNT